MCDLYEIENRKMVNTLERKNTFITAHINSKYRDDYYNTSASNYIYNLPKTFNNVKSITLTSISIPNTWYIFSEELFSNYFYIKIHNDIHKIVIPEGNYNFCELEKLLNEKYFHKSNSIGDLKHIIFSIDEFSLKSSFKLSPKCKTKFHFSVVFIDDKIDQLIFSAGWTLGFRYAEYINVEDKVKSEGLFDGGGDRYLYLSLTDFNKNSANNNIILLQKSIILEDIIAKIYLHDGKFAINIDTNNDGCCSFTKTRRYFGPVNLQKIKIKLLDQYGRQINLNNMDYSFSLEIEQKYNS